MNSETEILQQAIGVAVASGSVGVWVWIALCWRSSRRVLPAEPRRPVPWGPIGLVVASLLVLLTLSSFIASHFFTEMNDEGFSKEKFVQGATISGLFFLSLAICGVWALKTYSGADRRDLGLPLSLGELGIDLLVGVFTFLALILPVFTLQLVLVVLFGQPSANPLIEQMRGGVDLQLAVVAFFSAAFVAPIFEEFVFRLLLQGWLEKQEWRTATEESIQGEADDRRDTRNDFFEVQPDGADAFSEITIQPIEQEPFGEIPEDDSPFSSPQTLSHPAAEHAETPRAELVPETDWPRGRKSWYGLPYGLPSILITSTLFSLAHLGNGPDPIPLFLFGLIVGYVYQRTHRILPCILAHMFFNGFTLVLLALEVSKPG